MKKRLRGDLSGLKYGMVTAIYKSIKTDVRGKPIWVCRCDCGNDIEISSQNLLRTQGNRSCGCVKPKLFWKMRFYMTWRGMISRCFNKKDKSYKDYGGRGITVCKKWADDYMEFHNWATKYWKNGLSLDRRNNNKNYCPQNCRFATPLTQANNRRITPFITINGKTKSLREWCDKHKIDRSLVYKRIKLGWDIEKSLLTKTQRPNARKYRKQQVC